MACVTHVCAETAVVSTRNDAARLKALALAALVEHPSSSCTMAVDDLVAAAASAAPAPTLART
jgi:hypothetical protein